MGNTGEKSKKVDFETQIIINGDSDLEAFVKTEEYTKWNLIVHHPMHVASAMGRIDIVKKFLRKRFSVNFKDDRGWTPLMYASWQGHWELVKFLVQKSASIHERDSLGWTAADYAHEHEHPQIAQYLFWKSHLYAKKMKKLKLKNK